MRCFLVLLISVFVFGCSTVEKGTSKKEDMSSGHQSTAKMPDKLFEKIKGCFTCKGRTSPGGACYTGPGGAMSISPGGACYSGPGGTLYSGPGGNLYAGPGGNRYSGPGGVCYTGPGGNCACSDKQATCPELCFFDPLSLHQKE